MSRREKQIRIWNLYVEGTRESFNEMNKLNDEVGREFFTASLQESIPWEDLPDSIDWFTEPCAIYPKVDRTPIYPLYAEANTGDGCPCNTYWKNKSR